MTERTGELRPLLWTRFTKILFATSPRIGDQVNAACISREILRLVDKPQIDWKVKREPNLDVVVVEKCTLVENEFWEEQVSRSPLSVRGWVVQERWLSPRNPRFGTREVFFECAQTTFCERFPDKFPEALLEGDVILKAAFSRLQMTQN